MDPKKGLTLRALEVGALRVAADAAVWIWEADASSVEIEYRDRRARVPRDAVVERPVPSPTLAELLALDLCFAGGAELFDTEHSDARYFSIERCRAHGRRFLRDMQGGIAMYERLTLLDESDAHETPDAIWRKYHALSDDWLNLLGRSR